MAAAIWPLILSLAERVFVWFCCFVEVRWVKRRLFEVLLLDIFHHRHHHHHHHLVIIVIIVVVVIIIIVIIVIVIIIMNLNCKALPSLKNESLVQKTFILFHPSEIRQRAYPKNGAKKQRFNLTLNRRIYKITKKHHKKSRIIWFFFLVKLCSSLPISCTHIDWSLGWSRIFSGFPSSWVVKNRTSKASIVPCWEDHPRTWIRGY